MAGGEKQSVSQASQPTGNPGGQDPQRSEDGPRINTVPFLPPEPPQVLVVGAGIAGLTAAHELASRGFKVTVVERMRERRGRPGGAAVGGLARSQFAWYLRSDADAADYREEAGAQNWGGCDDPVKNLKAVLRPQNESSPHRQDPTPCKPSCDEPAEASGAPLTALRAVWDNRSPPIPPEDQKTSGFVHARHAVPLAQLRVKWTVDATLGDQPVTVQLCLDLPDDVNARLTSVDRYMGWLAPSHTWDPSVFRVRVLVGPGFPTTLNRAAVLGELESKVREALIVSVRDTLPPCSDEVDKLLTNFFSYAHVQLVDLHQDPNVVGSSGCDGRGWIEIEFPEDVGERRGHVQECAGEHGYRFFPSFYAHVFDSMRRTPLLEPSEGETADDDGQVHRTAYDNLCSLTHFLFGRADGQPPHMMDKSVRLSLTSLFRNERLLLARLGFETRDLVRVQVKQLQYLTSCRARRDVTASITWAQYMGMGDGGYSATFEEAMRKWPQALVGLQADRADARTFGDITMQQLLDPLRSDEKKDATLNGPTSTAWLDPWRRYLERVYEVDFRCGEAQRLYFHQGACDTPKGVRVQFSDGLEYANDGKHVDHDPKEWLPYRGEVTTPVPNGPGELAPDAYLVLAVAPNEAYRLMRTLDSSATLALDNNRDPCDGSDASKGRPLSEGLEKLKRDVERSRRDGWIGRTFRVLDGQEDKSFRPGDVQTQAYVEDSALQNFVGLQYFFVDRDVPFVRGHLFLPDHPFAMSAISQQQFRVARGSGRWVAGTLSLDLGDPTGHAEWVDTGRMWDLSREQIAQEVWHHLGTCFQVPSGPTNTDLQAADGVLYHIDEGFYFGCIRKGRYPWLDVRDGSDTASDSVRYGQPWFVRTNLEDGGGTILPDARGISFNNTPYLVVRAGAYQHWPGTIDPDRPQRGYDVEFGNFVCCGTHCKTFTRLGTMEAANESARHAVNGILRDFDRPKGGWNSYGGGGTRKSGSTPSIIEARSAGDAGGASVESAYVPVWTLEEREPEDLGLLKTIDEALFKEGMPHLFEVLKLDEMIRSALPTGNGAPSEPNLVDDLLRLVEGGRMDFRHLSRWASPFTLAMLGTLLKMPGSGRR